MSHYSFRVDRRGIVVGWDNPLQTFFVQVWENSDEDDPVLWVGTWPEEVTSVEALAEVMRPYGEIPAEVLAQLHTDFDGRKPQTAWQRQVLSMVAKP